MYRSEDSPDADIEIMRYVVGRKDLFSEHMRPDTSGRFGFPLGWHSALSCHGFLSILEQTLSYNEHYTVLRYILQEVGES